MSYYIHVPKEAFDLVYTLGGKYPQFKETFDSIESDLNNRQWHQLSDNLMALSEKKELQQSTDLIEIYNSLILQVDKAFNPMKLMMLISNIVKNFASKIYWLTL